LGCYLVLGAPKGYHGLRAGSGNANDPFRDPVKGEYALSCGLVDALFENDQDFRAHVLGFATRVSQEGDPKRSCVI
jgi:enoyl-CoA hydratase/carnithine racemase